MHKTGKRFEGVSGKTVDFIESYRNEEGQPRIYIQFRDKTALDILVELTPKISSEWWRVKNGDLVPLQRS
jgi:hypothetical protein